MRQGLLATQEMTANVYTEHAVPVWRFGEVAHSLVESLDQLLFDLSRRLERLRSGQPSLLSLALRRDVIFVAGGIHDRPSGPNLCADDRP
jgi:hypothetical protein